MYERNGTLIRQKYREFILPLLLTSSAFSLGSLLQNAMIGHFLDDSALSAIGLTSPLMLFLETISFVFSVGGVTCATTWLSKLDLRRAKLSFTLAVSFSVAIALLFCGYAYGHLDAIADSLADSDPHIAALAIQYLRPVLIVGALNVLTVILVAFISADGHPRYTCSVIIAANVLQLLLSYVLIRHLNLGIRGAGLALMGGYIGECVLTLAYFLRRKSSFSFAMPALRDLKLLPSMLSSGFNMGWMMCCHLLGSSALILLLVIFSGPDSLFIMVVCTNITVIVDIIIDATTDTLLPITSLLYGEQDYYGIRQLVRTSLKMLLLVSAFLALLFILLPGCIGALFGVDSPEVMDKLIPALRLYATSLPLYAMSTFLQHYYNIIEQKRLASFLSLLKSLVFLLPSAVVLAKISPDWIWLSFTLAEGLSLLVVISLGQRIKKKRGLQHMLLPMDNRQAAHLSFTMTADAKAAQALVQRIIAFGKTMQQDKRLINHVAVAAEEMTVAAAHFAFRDTGDGLIDFFMCVAEDQVVVRFRDNGDAFNPVEYTPPQNSPCITDGIELLVKMADSLKYSRQLGFNTTTLTFTRKAGERPCA